MWFHFHKGTKCDYITPLTWEFMDSVRQMHSIWRSKKTFQKKNDIILVSIANGVGYAPAYMWNRDKYSPIDFT